MGGAGESRAMDRKSPHGFVFGRKRTNWHNGNSTLTLYRCCSNASSPKHTARSNTYKDTSHTRTNQTKLPF